MALAARYLPSRVDFVPYADDELDEPTFRKRLGYVITQLRLARGFRRQPDFAAAVGVGARTIIRWEKGETAPNAWDLRRLSDCLEVPIATFIDPPQELDFNALKIGYSAEMTARREMLKRQQRRRGGGALS